MTLVVCHQPDFVPYLGFFDRLLDADVFVLLDDVQFLRRGWHHRDRIKTRAGSEWLTLAVEKCPRDTPIAEVRLAANRAEWVPGLLNLLVENYRQAPYFEAVFPRIGELLERPWQRLTDINLAFLDLAYEFFGLRPNVVMASEIGVDSTSNQRLIDLVHAVGGDSYITGTGALDYLDFNLWERAGIDLRVQSFQHPVYPQLHGAFEPMMSCLDLFFNCGRQAGEVLRSCRA